jgi:hypothetical protein
MALVGFLEPALTPFLHSRTILPDMFGLSGDIILVLIITIILIVLAALVVKYLSKSVELQIRFERELRITRQQELKIKSLDDEVKRLKAVEVSYNQYQASMMNLTASHSYGATEMSEGNYGEVEAYQHYEQIPVDTYAHMAKGKGQGHEQESPVETEAPTVRTAVAKAVPIRTGPAERGDFNIQDVFVVYKDGRLVTHLSRKVRIIDDSEIIGSMITAVQTFVRESFRREAKGVLEELKFGDIRILMEYGKSLNIALVIRGTKYEGVRPVVKEILDALHVAWRAELASDKWNGNLANIAALEKVIQKDLLDRFNQETFHRSDSKYLDLSKAKVFHPDE